MRSSRLSLYSIWSGGEGEGGPAPLKVTRISCTQTLIVIGPLASCRLYRSNRRTDAVAADAGLIAGSTISLLTELMLQHYNSSLDGGECEVLSAASHKAAPPPPPPSRRPPGIQSDGRTEGRQRGQSKLGQQRRDQRQRHHSLFVVVIVGLTHLRACGVALPRSLSFPRPRSPDRPVGSFVSSAAFPSSLVAVFEAWLE